MLAVMSDASGFGSGGVSDVIHVGPPAGSSQCNAATGHPDFTFQTNSALAQCRAYTFSAYTGAVQPINITGLIPGGTSFVLDPPDGSTSYSWMTDLSAGTSVVFFMEDSQGRQGGSTQLYTVGLSDESTCLTGSYPSSLAVQPSATTSSGASTSILSASTSSTTSSESATAKSSVMPIGAIAGAVVGGVLGLVVAALLAILLVRRNRNNTIHYGDEAVPYRGGRDKHETIDPADETGDEMYPIVSPYPLFNPTIPGPDLSSVSGYMYSSSHSASGPSHSRQSSFAGAMPEAQSSEASSQGPTMLMGPRRKAAMAGVSAYPSTTRFIVHTDAEEVVELPPKYSSLRAGPSLPVAMDPMEQPHASSFIPP
ncbi:uncharacterized protein FIBRA_07414 [Fibroporia radiculosa]|uniref:Mid2 domain-containing protein n=1 Tax=Fibroporia radiculosa TaxID=599839 RepID=J4GUY0_9APHY|nr:uncharacterized protein FIBRA_07414 [Fibroporia radiculosa]CCM05205.1 predicted protein [Fibroporia radiculosa]